MATDDGVNKTMLATNGQPVRVPLNTTWVSVGTITTGGPVTGGN
jgi:hypothetical protein